MSDRTNSKRKNSDTAPQDPPAAGGDSKRRLMRLTCDPCAVCLRDISEVQDLRILSGCCGPVICMECLRELLISKDGKRILTCPLCIHVHSFSGVDNRSDIAVLESKTSKCELIQHRFAVPTVIQCTYNGCTLEATHFCTSFCGNMCATHLNQNHLLFSGDDHRAMLLSDRAAFMKKQTSEALQKMVEKRKPATEQAIRSFTSCINYSKSAISSIKSRTRQLKSAERQLQGLADWVNGKLNENARQQFEHSMNACEANRRLGILSQQSETQMTFLKQEESAASRGTIASDVQHAAATAFAAQAYRDICNVYTTSANLFAVQTPPLGEMINYELNRSPLLPNLSSKSGSMLQSFLPGIKLASANLTYRMSRDGARIQDLSPLAFTDKVSSALVLVKVVHSKNIFGFFLNNTPVGSRATFRDLFGQSFVFSLKNQLDAPFKLKIRASAKGKIFTMAISPESGLTIQATDETPRTSLTALPSGGSSPASRPLIQLMRGYQSANQAQSNTFERIQCTSNNDTHFELDEASFGTDNPKPKTFQNDQFGLNVLGASVSDTTDNPLFFAAEEIEIFNFKGLQAL